MTLDEIKRLEEMVISSRGSIPLNELEGFHPQAAVVLEQYHIIQRGCESAIVLRRKRFSSLVKEMLDSLEEVQQQPYPQDESTSEDDAFLQGVPQNEIDEDDEILSQLMMQASYKKEEASAAEAAERSARAKKSFARFADLIGSANRHLPEEWRIAISGKPPARRFNGEVRLVTKQDLIRIAYPVNINDWDAWEDGIFSKMKDLVKDVLQSYLQS